MPRRAARPRFIHYSRATALIKVRPFGSFDTVYMEFCNITIFSLFLTLYTQKPRAGRRGGMQNCKAGQASPYFFFDGPVDGGGGFLTGAHGQDDGGPAPVTASPPA